MPGKSVTFFEVVLGYHDGVGGTRNEILYFDVEDEVWVRSFLAPLQHSSWGEPTLEGMQRRTFRTMTPTGLRRKVGQRVKETQEERTRKDASAARGRSEWSQRLRELRKLPEDFLSKLDGLLKELRRDQRLSLEERERFRLRIEKLVRPFHERRIAQLTQKRTRIGLTDEQIVELVEHQRWIARDDQRVEDAKTRPLLSDM